MPSHAPHTPHTRDQNRDTNAHPHPTPHQHDHQPPPPPHPRRRPLLVLLCVAQFMLIADVTVVNVALPAIATDLSLSGPGLTWVVTAYTLFFGALLLAGGRLADRFGAVRTFLTGLALFTAASAASGLAADSATLIAARSAQGVGAALLSPAALSLVTTLFQGPARNRALGAWAAIGGTGAALGVLLGGILTDGPGWRWIFYLNLPVGVLALLGVPLLLGRALRGTAAGRRTPVNIPATLLPTLAAAALVYGLTERSWLPAVGALAAAALLLVTQRRSTNPLMPPAMPGRRSLLGGSAVMLGAAGLLVTGFYLSSLHIQQSLGRSPLVTGLAFLPAAVAATAGAHLGSRLLPRFGWRPVGAAAFTLAAAGAALTSLDGLWSGLVPGFALLALGLGAAFVCATTSALSEVPPAHTGLASGLVGTSHELGAALAIAALASADFTTLAYPALALVLAVPFLLPPGHPDPTSPHAMAH
ncbi:MFS transporter [Streptomyces sp. NBC_00335]|uniref:MFS transporter n=1 Tax=unclassified Streptomyces TaxID=2593676 RepID=UPI00225ADA68|nr:MULTISPECIES: MFS transporter [unclassified Streptomyces]MCX5407292.1 MFS transporter [Streptomyces sp. NBC_00086]